MRIRKGEVIGETGGGPKMKMPRLPRRGTRLVVPVLIVLLLIVGMVRYCFAYIAPNEVGIKEVRVGLNRGIHENVYGPGYAFRIPFGFEYIHRFPKNVQVLELTGFNEPAGEVTASHQYEKSVKIQTSDGYYVDVDVTILYRIDDPYKVITTLGPGTRYLEMGLLPRAEPNLKQAYGELTTEDFYNSPRRVKQGELALELLNRDLNEKGIEVDQVLVRYFVYSDEIQKNIEDKKLKDQLVFTNQSKARAAQAEAELKRVTQEGEMKVLVTEEEGTAYKVQKDAERDLYTRTKRAEADLLLQLAEAKRTEYRNEAMQTVGSDTAVAMKMAEVLQGLDVMIIPTGGTSGINPLDLNGMLDMFGAATPRTEAAGPVTTTTPSFMAPPPSLEAPVPAPIPETAAPAATEVTTDETR